MKKKNSVIIYTPPCCSNPFFPPCKRKREILKLFSIKLSWYLNHHKGIIKVVQMTNYVSSLLKGIIHPLHWYQHSYVHWINHQTQSSSNHPTSKPRAWWEPQKLAAAAAISRISCFVACAVLCMFNTCYIISYTCASACATDILTFYKVFNTCYSAYHAVCMFKHVIIWSVDISVWIVVGFNMCCRCSEAYGCYNYLIFLTCVVDIF